MSWQRAPLYVRAHDFARWAINHVDSWPAASHGKLRDPVAAAVLDLLGAIALALTFPASRAGDCERADRSVVLVRTLLRLSVELGRTSPQQMRFAAAELDAIGRMLGGWRKSSRLRSARERKGVGAQAAPTA